MPNQLVLKESTEMIYTCKSCSSTNKSYATDKCILQVSIWRKYLVKQLLLIHTGIFASLIGFQPLHGHRVLGTSSALLLDLIVLPAFLRYSRYRGRYSPAPRPNKSFWAVISRAKSLQFRCRCWLRKALILRWARSICFLLGLAL